MCRRLFGLLLTASFLVMTLALATVGCASGEVASSDTVATAETSLPPTTTAAQTESDVTTTTASTETAASTTTTAYSRPITTEPPPGAVRLESGDVQATGYIFAVSYAPPADGPTVAFVPAQLLADVDDVAAVLRGLRKSDPRVTGYRVSPMVSITVSTVGDGGKEAITLDEFIGLWGPSPLEGGEHLCDVPWTIRYDPEDAMVWSIAEETP